MTSDVGVDTDKDDSAWLSDQEPPALIINEIQTVIEDNYEEIFKAERNWKILNDRISFWLSDEFLDDIIEIILNDDESALGPEQVTSRALQRTLITDLKKDLKGNINDALTRSKRNAEIFIWGDQSERKYAAAELEVLKDSRSSETDSYKIAVASLQIEATELYIQAFCGDRQILEPIFEVIREDAALISQLLAFFENDAIDIHDYKGLLDSLARNHFDPGEVSLIDVCISTLKDHPESCAKTYTVPENCSVGEIASPTAQWLRTMGRFAIQQGLDPQSVQEFFDNEEYDELPSVMRDEIAADNVEYLEDVRRRLIALLEPYKQIRRFIYLQDPLEQPHTNPLDRRKGPRKKSGGRVTAKKTQNNKHLIEPEKEQRRQINTVAFARQKGKHFVLADAIDASSALKDGSNESTMVELLDQIMEERCFRDYAKKYRNEADVRSMITSILTDPTGNGVTPMKDQRVQIEDQESVHNRPRPVLHFSPKDSSGISFNQSTESVRTRIFYALMDDKLVILDIQHKEAAENQKGTFVKR